MCGFRKKANNLGLYVCNVFGRKNSVEIGTIVVLSVLMSHSEAAYTNTFMYVVDRVIDTSMGVIVAMFVNKFMFRKNNDMQIN